MCVGYNAKRKRILHPLNSGSSLRCIRNENKMSYCQKKKLKKQTSY